MRTLAQLISEASPEGEIEKVFSAPSIPKVASETSEREEEEKRSPSEKDGLADYLEKRADQLDHVISELSSLPKTASLDDVEVSEAVRGLDISALTQGDVKSVVDKVLGMGGKS